MYDVIVIGGGTAGLSVAQILGRARRNVLVLADGDTRNSPSAGVHGIITRDGVPPAELTRAATDELAAYPAVTVRRDRAISVDGQRGDFVVQFASGEIAAARRVVLATGVVDELPSIDGLAERWGTSVLHCPYCHGWEVRDKPLAVLALSILDAYVAAHLTQWSSDVLFCLNGVQFDEAQYVVLNSAGVRIQGGKVVALEGQAPALQGVRFDDGEVISRDALFLHAPTRQRSDLAAQLECRILDDGAVEVDELGQTTAPGIYAVGDMARRASQEPDLTFTARAMGDGVITGVAVNRELFFESLAFG